MKLGWIVVKIVVAAKIAGRGKIVSQNPKSLRNEL